jgi:hypothetical protein
MSRQIFAGALLALTAVATVAYAQRQPTQTAAASGRYLPEYTKDGDLMLPKNWRSWVYVGSPLTPDGLNDSKEGFPEYHNVYIEPGSYEIYKKTGAFPEGTIMFKELQRVLGPPQFPDGALATFGAGVLPRSLQRCRRDRQGFQAVHRDREHVGLLQLQSSRAEGPDCQAAAEGEVRILPSSQRKKGRGLDAVLSLLDE